MPGLISVEGWWPVAARVDEEEYGNCQEDQGAVPVRVDPGLVWEETGDVCVCRLRLLAFRCEERQELESWSVDPGSHRKGLDRHFADRILPDILRWHRM